MNLLVYTTFQKMGFLDKDFTTTNDSLYGFSNNLVSMKREIRLLATLSEVPHTATQLADFIVVDKNISYNAFLGDMS